MNNQHKQVAFGPVINRIPDLMIHASRYDSRSAVERLAEDTGISRSSIAHLIKNEGNPSFVTIARITGALERHLGCRIDPRDLLSEWGHFPTDFTCDLVGCRGCLPVAATDSFGYTTKAFEGVKAGTWVTSRYPNGFEPGKGVRHGN